MHPKTKWHIIISAICAILFIPFLGSVHLFDWDEINFAEAAREMILSKNYLKVQIGYQMFWEKPPLFIWMQVISMKIFGVNEFAARFPNALLGIILPNLLFHFGNRIKNRKFGILWAGIYVCSILPFFYFKTGIIDPWFNLFIYFGIYLWYRGINRFKIFSAPAVLAGFCIGLAILTKGPVALLIYGLVTTVYVAINRDHWKWITQRSLWSFIGILSVPGLWFFYDYIHNGPEFMMDFIWYQIELFQKPGAGHQQPFYYHPLVLLIGCFPMSAFVISAIKIKGLHLDKNGRWLQISWIAFLSVLILFSIVQTKIIHYSSFCYLPMSYIAAHHLYACYRKRETLRVLPFLLIGIIIALALIIFPIFMANPEWWPSIIQNEWTLEKLSVSPQWYVWESFWGLLLLIITVICYRVFKDEVFLCLKVSGISVLVILSICLVTFTPKIEKFVQAPCIEMIKDIDSENNYLDVIGAKSYADLFYSHKLPCNDPIEQMDSEKRRYYMLLKPISKDAYFICPSVKSNEFKSNFQLKEIESNGGWTLLKRAKTN